MGAVAAGLFQQSIDLGKNFPALIGNVAVDKLRNLACEIDCIAVDRDGAEAGISADTDGMGQFGSLSRVFGARLAAEVLVVVTRPDS